MQKFALGVRVVGVEVHSRVVIGDMREQGDRERGKTKRGRPK